MSKSQWITVATFTYPTEVALIKSYLEAEGIAFNMKDELAVQADNFLSNAIGGVKLQVKPEDVERVKQIVIEFGFTPEEDFTPSRFWTEFDALTVKFPLVGKLKIEVRLFVMAALALLILVTSGLFLLRPSLEERLAGTKWCLNYIEHEGEKYTPKTTAPVITGLYNCDEILKLSEGLSLDLPGFDSRGFSASGSLIEGRLEIYEASAFSDIFNGFYDVDLDSETLILESEKTIIHCTKAVSNGFNFMP